MLSRVANSIYWINRYIERAENYARFIDVNFHLMFDLPPEISEQWAPLVITMADEKLFKQYFDQPTRDHVLYFMTFEMRNPNSILSNLYQARENARTIRETISKEMWEHINQFYLRVKEAAHQQMDMLGLQAFYNEVKMGSQLFFGIVDSTITRSDGWHFGRVGRFLERADKISRFVDVKYFILLPDTNLIGSPLDILQWSSVLKSASAYNMFRQQYKEITPANIVEFLVLDKLFPRSVLYSLLYAETSLREISGTSSAMRYSNDAEKKLSRLRSEIEFTSIDEVFDIGLHEFIDGFQAKNNEVGQSVFDTFFAIKPI